MDLQVSNLGANNIQGLEKNPIKINTVKNNNCENAKEYVSSKASLAARAYATPQVNFEGKWDKMLSELKSTKQSNKIKMSFDETANFLKRLGFNERGGKGSHCNFVKDGVNPITIARPHDGHNTVKPYTIDSLREYIQQNNVVTL